MTAQRRGCRDAFAADAEKMSQGGVYDQLAGGFHRYGGRALGGAAFREDALRQYGAAAQLRARLPELCAPEFAQWRRRLSLAGRDDDGPRARRVLCLAGCGYRSGRRRRLLYLDARPRRRRCSIRLSLSLRQLLGHRRVGRYAPQPGQECAAREAIAGSQVLRRRRSLESLRGCATQLVSQAAGGAASGPRLSSTRRSIRAGMRWR
jgi:hypothetical protein